MTTKISVDNIQANTLSVLGGAGPRITGIVVTNSSYQATGETVIDTSGGYIIINGTGFVANCNVIVGIARTTNTVFANSTTVRTQVPALPYGKYTLYVENPDGSTAFRPLLVGNDKVQWILPTNNYTISSNSNTNIILPLSANAISNTTITYSSPDLPSGITITGNTLSGQVAQVGNSVSTLIATAGSGKKANNTLNFYIANLAQPVSQVAFTTPGTYTWIAPERVTSVSVVCVGAGGAGGAAGYGGGGGGGGGLGYKNNISVIPGQSYTVVVGAGGVGVSKSVGGIGSAGGDSYFINSTTVKGGGGGAGLGTSDDFNRGPWSGGAGGTYVGDGGGNGGAGGQSINDFAAGGGGAAGYSGNGGDGAGNGTAAQIAGSGGGASGGRSYDNNGAAGGAGSGGGVGILGQGTSGGISANNTDPTPGGSGGGTGGAIFNTGGSTSKGGDYGGGGGGQGSYNNTSLGCNGGGGAVRIIWGAGRSFPSTNTGNL